MSDPSSRPALSLLGCGCAAVVAVLLAVMVGLTWIGYRSTERYREEMADPAAREARVAALLPHASLPPGYHAIGGISIPLLMEMAVIADREPGPLRPDDPADPGVQAGFLYVRTRDAWGRRQRLQKLFAAENPDPAAFSQGEVGFTPKEEVGRGEVEAGGATVHYYARRGELAVDQTRFGVELPAGAEPVEALRRRRHDDAHRLPGRGSLPAGGAVVRAGGRRRRHGDGPERPREPSSSPSSSAPDSNEPRHSSPYWISIRRNRTSERATRTAARRRRLGTATQAEGSSARRAKGPAAIGTGQRAWR